MLLILPSEIPYRIASHPPDNQQYQVRAGNVRMAAPGFQTGEAAVAVEPFRVHQRCEVGHRNKQKQVIPQCLFYMQMQQLVDGPLRTAGGTLQPCKPVKGALGCENGLFGIYREKERQSGKNRKDSQFLNQGLHRAESAQRPHHESSDNPDYAENERKDTKCFRIFGCIGCFGVLAFIPQGVYLRGVNDGYDA